MTRTMKVIEFFGFAIFFTAMFLTIFACFSGN